MIPVTPQSFDALPTASRLSSLTNDTASRPCVFSTTILCGNSGRTTDPEATASRPRMLDPSGLSREMGVPNEALGRVVSRVIRPAPTLP